MFKFILLFFLSFSSLASEEGNMQKNQQMTKRSKKIREVFNQLRADKLSILDSFYAPDVEFNDPIEQLNGLDALKGYYAEMYKNVSTIRFEFKTDAVNGNRHLSVWTMYLKAEGLNGGKEVKVEGVSEIVFNDKDLVTYHRDYFDMGEFIYEHIPVFGSILSLIKSRLEYKESK